MIQKNFNTKNINIRKYKLYFKFYKHFYEKKKNISYIIALLFVLLKLNNFFIKLYILYSNIYLKFFYKSNFSIKVTNYLKLSNKYKFIDKLDYSITYRNNFILNGNKYLYLYNINTNRPNNHTFFYKYRNYLYNTSTAYLNTTPLHHLVVLNYNVISILNRF